MSAATMIACAADEIIMGKQSAIGPIDPQIFFGNHSAPAQSLLDDFEKAKEEVSSNPNLAPLWVSKMRDYPPGIFNICENTINVAKEKVTTWISQYMFKKRKGSREDAEKIAEWLGDANFHRTHGHPISYDEALRRGLKVSRLEDDNKLQDLVMSIFHATSMTFVSTPCVKIIENQFGKGLFTRINQE